jgi:hypothetical protein
MSEEKTGYSSSNEGGRPKNKKKYLYLENFNKYTALQQEAHDADMKALWKINFLHGIVTMFILIVIVYILSKI